MDNKTYVYLLIGRTYDGAEEVIAASLDEGRLKKAKDAGEFGDLSYYRKVGISFEVLV